MNKDTYYDVVLEVHQESPVTRGNETELHFKVWEKQGIYVPEEVKEFLRMVRLNDSIRRASQQVRRAHPELQPEKEIVKKRQAIEKQKGTHVYRETLFELPVTPTYYQD